LESIVSGGKPMKTFLALLSMATTAVTRKPKPAEGLSAKVDAVDALTATLGAVVIDVEDLPCVLQTR